MGNMKGWENWINEYRRLVEMASEGESSLPTRESHRLNYLRNLLEAGLGLKSTLSEDNQRLEMRIDLSVEASIEVEGKKWSGKTINAGIWGVFIAVADPPPKGLKGLARIITPQETIPLECLVKWSSATPIGAMPPGAGLRFTNHRSKEHHAYRDFFFNCLKQAIVNKIKR